MAGQAKVYFQVATTSTTFGITLQIDSLIYCTATKKIYRLDAAALKTDTLLTVANTAITSGSGTGGTGDVVGPGSAINENIAVFDGVTGKLIKDGGRTVASMPYSGDAADTLADAYTIPFWNTVASAWKKITWANIKTALTTVFDALYLKLDQTAGEQTITGGTPKLDRTIAQIGLDEKNLTNVEYVKNAVTALNANFYMLDTASGIGTWKLTSLSPSPDIETSVTVAALADLGIIQGWISPVAATPSMLIAGIYNMHFHIEKTAGTKTLKTYWELIEYKADTSEVIVGTSEIGKAITALIEEDLHLVNLALYTPTAGSRFVGLLRASVSGAGTAPTAKIYYRGTTAAAFSVPTNIEVLSDTFAYKDLTNTNTTTLAEESTPVAGMMIPIDDGGTMKKVDFDKFGGGATDFSDANNIIANQMFN